MVYHRSKRNHVYADREWSDPDCAVSLNCSVTVMTGTKQNGWLVPRYEEYDDVWVDMERGEFINCSKTNDKGHSFRHQQRIQADNASVVLAQIREKMTADIEEKKK